MSNNTTDLRQVLNRLTMLRSNIVATKETLDSDFNLIKEEIRIVTEIVEEQVHKQEMPVEVASLHKSTAVVGRLPHCQAFYISDMIYPYTSLYGHSANTEPFRVCSSIVLQNTGDHAICLHHQQHINMVVGFWCDAGDGSLWHRVEKRS